MPRVFTSGNSKVRLKRKGRFRSNFELLLSKQLIDKGAQWRYEFTKYEYFTPVVGGIICEVCGPSRGLQRRTYLPDFFLSNGVVIEGKGLLTASDRKKLESVRKYHPSLDLRIVFQYNRRYTKDGRRYSDWAEKHGIPWAISTIPDSWLLHSDQPWPKRIDSLFKANKDVVMPPKRRKRKKKEFDEERYKRENL